MQHSDVSKGFRLEEVRSASPMVVNPEDDPLAERILARVTRAASDAASSSSSRRTTKSSKPIHNARWEEPREFFLQPNERHFSTVTLTKPGLLLVRANWTGTAQALKLAAELLGARPVTGKATRVPPDRGTALLSTRIETAGRVEVSIRNPDRTNGASVELVVGTMPIPAS